MGGIAGPSGARRRRLTRWAFALDEVALGGDDRVALVLAPSLVARVPPLSGDALANAGDARSVVRRQVLAALAARLCPAANGPGGLTVNPDGLRRLAGGLYASVAERSSWVAAVMSRAPVGIDLESVGEAQTSAAAVLDGVDIVDPAAWHGLAGVWAAREATLKAMGRDLTTDPGGWRFGTGSVTAAGCPTHRVDLVALPAIIAAVAYVGG